MSKTTGTKKTVKIKENELVDLIDNILNEAVSLKKTEWLNEQAKKESDDIKILSEKISKLEEKFIQLSEGKK